MDKVLSRERRLVPASGCSLSEPSADAKRQIHASATHFTIVSRAKTWVPSAPNVHCCVQLHTFEQQPPKISAIVTLQLMRAGQMFCIVAAVIPMALETVRGRSGSWPDVAESSNGPTFICFVPGGICVPVEAGARL